MLVTISNSSQPSYILKATIPAGVQQQKQQNLKKMPGIKPMLPQRVGYSIRNFLNFWASSFTLKTLKEICSKTSSISGIPFPRPFRNILEQLFVKLWCYNAEMLHARMQLEVLDVRIWDLPT